MALMKKQWLCVLTGILTSTSLAVNIETVTVGALGNERDTRHEVPGYGSIGYEYQIGKFEVTVGQYTEFLNAVARTDTYALYDTQMAYPMPTVYGANIQRTGEPGTYSYSVAPEYAGRPVNYVSWGDAARFANWMHNGQPTGEQAPATTEDGSYYLNGAITNEGLLAVTRKPNATWVIPTEDEWYKAAYYDPDKSGGAGYWDYPTRSDQTPSSLADPNGTNNANYNPDRVLNRTPMPVGTFGSPSAYGTFDQGGNLAEWNEAVINTYYRGVRGGAFDQSETKMLAWARSSVQAVGVSRGRGFRLAHVPEPGSAVLCFVGILGLLARPRTHRRLCCRPA